MPNSPSELRYHPKDTWARLDGGRVRVGVTDFAQEELDTVVFVDLPQVGDRLEQGEAFGQIESSKTVSDLVAPVSGTILERNEALQDDPEAVNRDPYGQGWMVLIEVDDVTQLDGLLSAEEYDEQTE
jgi:glycine cleavage system H protein